MNSKLFIRNLAYSTTEDELLTLFSPAGTVISVDIMKDRVSSRSKGYGFIQMSSQVQAENAVEMLDGWTLDNCQLRVDLAQHYEARGGPRDFGSKK